MLSVAASLLLLMVSGFVAFRDQGIAHSDLAYVWTGPRTLLDGGNPYEPASWSRSLEHYDTALAGTPRVYSYPPHVAVALVPLGALPLAVAYAMWSWGSLVLALVAMWTLLRLIAPDRSWLYVTVPAVLLLSEPAVESSYGGQWALLMVAVEAGLVIAMVHRSRSNAALWTLAATAKPQITFVALLGLTLRCLRTGQRSIALAILMSGAALLLSTVMLAGDQLAAWITYVPSARVAETHIATLAATLGPLGAIFVAATAAVVAFLADGNSIVGAAPWLALGVLIAPYAHPYDQLVLIVPVVVAAHSRPTLALLGSLILLLLPWALFVLVPRSWGFESVSVVVPMLVFTIVSVAALATAHGTMLLRGVRSGRS